MIDWLKKTTNNFKSRVSGNHKFYVKIQPQNIDTSSTVTITVFTDKTESALVPCHFKWIKIRNGINQEITKYKGSSYMCDPSDIGSIVQVQIISNDPEYSGKAIAEFGPIRLSLDLRKQIQNTLINGSALINTSICYGDEQKECQLKIFQDMIKICHMFSDANYSFDYSLYEPRVENFNRDQTKVQIVFGEKHQQEARAFMCELFRRNITNGESYNREFRIQLSFQSRFFKDLFILTLKSFYTKRQLKNSAIIHKIEHSTFKEEQNFDYMFQIQSLKSDLAKTIQANDKNENDKTRYKQEVTRLEKQIEQIILTYTKIVEDKCKNQVDFNRSYSVLTNKREEVINKKYRNLQSQNLNLNERIKHLSAEIDEIRFNTSMVKNNQTKLGESCAFKKKASGIGFDQSNFVNMLDQLSFSHVKESPDDFIKVKNQLSMVEEEKVQLENKLEKSFQKIDNLEKQLRKQGANQNHTAINFSYASLSPQNSRLNITSPIQEKERMQKIIKQNYDLRRLTENLKSQNKRINAELSLSMSRITNKGNDKIKFSVGDYNNSTNLNITENGKLKKEIETLRKELEYANKNFEKQKQLNLKLNKEKLMLEHRIEQMRNELELYRKNQDIFNRSQNLSMEMNDYNEEQLRILKEHNEFLTSENEKLSAACEKYMKQARQNMKLRKQILNLKEKLNGKLLNPEHTVLSINI